MTDDERREQQEKNREASRNLERQSLWIKSQVRKRHETIPEKTEHPWWNMLSRVDAKRGSGMLVALLGNRGNGKTQLAAALIKKSCHELRPSKYITAMEFFLNVRDCYRDKSLSEVSVLSSYYSYELLVIDEIAERGETPWEDRLLTATIDRRYGDMKDTVLISNQTPEDFASSVSPSIMDRMRETGGIVVCDWPSFRAKA